MGIDDARIPAPIARGRGRFVDKGRDAPAVGAGVLDVAGRDKRETLEGGRSHRFARAIASASPSNAIRPGRATRAE